MSDSMTQLLVIIGMVLAGIIVISLIITKLYVRSTKERTYVRTGFGGQKVIMNGGALVFPVLHETMPVNMNTYTLQVRRAEANSLITKDKLRVDVTSEFYVRVKPDVDAIAIAAQTLGKRTINPQDVQQLVEGKLVDALRSVASGMTMEDMHINRAQFVQKVQQVCMTELAMNGLELESVSLTGFNQTDRSHFNENNAFDAEGLTILTQQIERRRKERNEVEQDTAVSIARKNREANQERLTIEREDQENELSQQRSLAEVNAQTQAEIAARESEARKAAEEARIKADREIETAALEARKATEAARISTDRSVQEAQIATERAVKEAEIERDKTLALARQQQNIAVAEKSGEESQAKAKADLARAEAVIAAESVTTAEETARANREKQIAVIAAEQIAESSAAGIRVAAVAEREAASDRAEAARQQAQGRADALVTEAKANAEAEREKAAALAVTLEVKAKGEVALNAAANSLSDGVLRNRVQIATIEALPNIIAESVKPMEKIDSIRIAEIGGLGGQEFGPGGEKLIQSGGGLGDQVVSAALRYRAQSPLIDGLVGEIFGDGTTLESLVTSSRVAVTTKAAE